MAGVYSLDAPYSRGVRRPRKAFQKCFAGFGKFIDLIGQFEQQGFEPEVVHSFRQVATILRAGFEFEGLSHRRPPRVEFERYRVQFGLRVTSLRQCGRALTG